MIDFNAFSLDNGLRVIFHEDKSTPFVATNILYDVGSRDEDEQQTGMAHLFEHLMFGGSVHVPDFDTPIQVSGGENNAFTNADVTNFYNLVPAENIETAFWVEADRMFKLNLTERTLNVQKRVVLEEFSETTTNQPYGEMWHHLAPLAFKEHPYQWPTIGSKPDHIRNVRMETAKTFYRRFYHPANAILVIAGNIAYDKVRRLVDVYFGPIPPGIKEGRQLKQEPVQDGFRSETVRKKLPANAIYMAFHMGARMDRDFEVCDLLSDILSGGRSSRFYRRLVKDKKLFTHVNAYITGTIDPGLMVVEAKLSEGVDTGRAREAIWEELNNITEHPVGTRELQKVKNAVLSSIAYSEVNILNKAINLAFYTLLGDTGMINRQDALYNRISIQEIGDAAGRIFRRGNCSELVYLDENGNGSVH